MAHEVETMMYVGATPWHGLGVKLEAAPTIGAALVAAGLDWTVECKPLVLAEDTLTCDSLESCRAISARAVVRSSDGAVLGIVGADYTPLQNAHAFDSYGPMVESGAATLETAGSLRGGRKVWILARTAASMADVIPGDAVEQFHMLSNSHDGSMSARVGFTRTRIVCANTLAMAHASGASQLLRIRHTANVADALAEVQRITDVSRRTFEATIEQYRLLAARGVNEADMRAYVKLVFAQPRPAASTPAILVVDASGEPIDTAGDRVANRVMELVETGRGADLKGVRGTLWGAYNAVTEYLTHERGTDADRRLDSLWFGNGATLNAKALTAALAIASGQV